ncbi:RNA-binding domain-containing protein [Bacteroides sp. L008]|uniref:RNA-binding domain-containing protein n=1 Tax=Bacteroides sp. L008 TaxID=3162404 RepID=UPI003465C227
MTSKELQQYLLQEFPIENARCEWKEMKNLKNSFVGDEKNDVISYISAIANMEGGHLVIGVQDKTMKIVGTDLSKFNLNTQSAVWKLLEHCTNLSSEGLNIDEYITEDENKIVWIIHIPKHLPRRPVYAHKKAWQRVEDSLVEMTQERLAVILEEPVFEAKDWSAEIVPNATMADLDELAVAKARIMFKKVHSSNISAEEIDTWTVEDFLSNSGIMIDRKLTRTAIILLGKPASVFKLRPAVVEVTWTLRDEHQNVVDYEHFTVPFILTVDKILSKIHNLTMRELPGGTLFPETMKQYDDYTIREALHNAIAHQDYTLQQRINFVENPSWLYYANGGSFIPGTLQKALETKGPQRHFRNECLCRAMVNFNMIDTVSRGIKKMFNEQRRRHFPMPDYEIDVLNKEVGVTIYGNTINEKYTQLLKENDTLTLEDCILLDAVQKGHSISEENVIALITKGLLEGNTSEYSISLDIAKKTKQLPDYTRNRGLEKAKLQQMILQYLQNAGSSGAKRDAIFDYLKDVLPKTKTQEQQERMVGNILTEMKEAETVIIKGRIWYAK